MAEASQEHAQLVDELGRLNSEPSSQRRAKWTTHALRHAVAAAQMSQDETQVGAALVDVDDAVILTGFNGEPRGVWGLPERRQRPEKYRWVSHAEMNLIAFAARAGIATEGCSVVVTHPPCSICMRLMIQAGVVAVRYGSGSTSMPREEFDAARAMAREAGVALQLIACEG